MYLTEKLAKFIVEIEYENIPETARQKAKQLVRLSRR